MGLTDRLNETVKVFFARHGYILTRYDTKHRREWMDRVTATKKETTLLLSHCEACQIISAVNATARIPGDLAEVGVAYGASAKLIQQHAHGKLLHLFDTFEGLPDTTTKDSAKFSKGQFRSDLDSVRRYLLPDNVRFYKGFFPGTAEPVKDTMFSFVHVDVDLYESTLACLQFFYPRLSPGGILISHDYLTAEGVNAAFEEFFADRPEPVIELTGYQCMIVKLAR